MTRLIFGIILYGTASFQLIAYKTNQVQLNKLKYTQLICFQTFQKFGRLWITEGHSLHDKTSKKVSKQLARPHTNSYCSLPRRLLIMAYDGVILFGLLVVASAIALPIGDLEKVAFEDFWFTLWLFLVCFAYLGGCWRYGGMTVGMRAWKVKLVSEDGGGVSWPRCLLRFLIAIISAGLFGLGFLWALIDKRKRGWHDLSAHTLLLRSKSKNKNT